MNLKNRLLLILLADVIAITATACSTPNKRAESPMTDTVLEGSLNDDDSLRGGSKDIIDEIITPTIPITGNDNSYENMVDTPSIELTPEEILEIALNERLYDANIDYNLVIKNYLDMDYDLRNPMKDDYLRAIYMLMLNSGIPIQTYLKELHIMMVMQQIPTCVPEDIWYASFGNLIVLSNGYPSLFEMFIDFATFVHEVSCEEEHKLNDYYAYTCKKLEEELKLSLSKQ